MGTRKDPRVRTRARQAFDAQAYLASSGTPKTVTEYGRGETIFTQGDSCCDVRYIQTGGVTMAVRSKAGREAVVETLGPGDFFGEGCLAGQALRMGSATAMTPSVILTIGKDRMLRLLRRQHAMSERFLSHMLSRNVRIEEDLLDRLFSSSEQRLAGRLLRLAGYGTCGKPTRVVRRIPSKTLAEMIGATPKLVKALLNKFRRLGFIEDQGKTSLRIDSSLLRVVLHD